jgi:hypothetical protein
LAPISVIGLDANVSSLCGARATRDRCGQPAKLVLILPIPLNRI